MLGFFILFVSASSYAAQEGKLKLADNNISWWALIKFKRGLNVNLNNAKSILPSTHNHMTFFKVYQLSRYLDIHDLMYPR